MADVFFRQTHAQLSSDHRQIKHRGATYNPQNRFAIQQAEAIDDGWWQEEERPGIATQVMLENAKSIISKNTSPDIPFSQSINPYRGCEHGCIYCFARPSHAYWDMSPGLDFETRLIAKPNAAQLLEETFRKPGYECKSIALGANTDAYQPIESQHGITRQLLEVLQRYRHPFSIVTKSALILRDLDILEAMGKDRLCSVFISITTLDDDLRKRMEPRGSTVTARLKALERLSSAGIFTGVMFAPVIPALNDAELELTLKAAADAGAKSAGYVLLRLPHEVSPLFRDWLASHYPGKAQHVMSLVQQSRHGQDYDSRFGERMKGHGQFAELIAKRFRLATRRFGLNQQRLALDTSQFTPPGQMSLW
ncbi:PA0069 family radical SAM protein [Pokkaliibacter sp. CJK22405]|uniref:PA0069 family radical SAM protein n=1 Tax=Pokkaliibacter sp. CJK22405 TaxID=3384615 RepID=UPI00398473D9